MSLYEEICKVVHEAPACLMVEVQHGPACATCQRTAQKIMEKVNQRIGEALSKIENARNLISLAERK